jgi:Fe-S oxidoreductase
MLLKTVLADRSALYRITALASRLQRFLPGKETGGSRHLPLFLPEILAGRRVPPISPFPLHSRVPGVVDPGPGIRVRGEVLLFAGCFFGYADPDPALAGIRLLTENGFRVRIPENQTCCGAPALLGGYPDIARKTVLRNLRALAGGQTVITLCATCGNCLTSDCADLFPAHSRERSRARDLSARIMDLHPFLADLNRVRLGPRPVERQVTVHDPCHLNRGLGGAASLRFLLGQVPGLELVEMETPDACCGGGGLCALHNPGLSRTLGRAKAEAVMASGAGTVAAPCPGCLLQINNCLSSHPTPVKAMHPARLMALTFAPSPAGKGRTAFSC